MNRDIDFKNFISFCLSTKGMMILLYGKKVISKAATFWGVYSGRIDSRDLVVTDKPGWHDGRVVNHPEYELWLYRTRF